ncbi:unnamed protein product [Trifolium pratense]|uniref:Uncharacterized protein n=1 Tax=Trifolium pratense TaxID=57577 RepID=A0ACB0M0A8_TRIPR|nr:unnamed protein product [Trifolium pratense]
MPIHCYPEFHRIILQDKKLRIPKKYVEKYWKHLSNPIFLRFPNGVEKKIFWVERNGYICFQKNWKNISKSLKYGYLLTFKYLGGTYFKVKIFAGNALEINYSNIKSIDEDEVVEDEEVIEVSEEECEIVKQPQRTTKSKRKIHMDLDSTQQKISSGNRRGFVKRVEKCSTSENPFFEIKLKKSYAYGNFMALPSKFSREHLENFVGTATLQVGNVDMPMKVRMKFDYENRRSILSGGWKLFSEKYNLQVKDSCKFVMIQRQPLLFTVIIKRAR